MTEATVRAIRDNAAAVKTLIEAINAVTGNDEQAVFGQFGEDFWDIHDQLHEDAPTRVGRQFSRMLIFVDRIREGAAHEDAYNEVMAMAGPALDGYFDSPAADPEDGAAGKGSPEPSDGPTISPPSA